MSTLNRIGICLLVPVLASAEVSTVAKGKWRVVCDSVEVSTHVTPYKAFTSGLNQGIDCDIFPPLRYEMRILGEKPVIQLSWDIPTSREDGTSLKLEEIKEFRIYESDVLIASVPSSDTSLLWPSSKGTHYFTISTVDAEGLEGAMSTPLRVPVD